MEKQNTFLNHELIPSCGGIMWSTLKAGAPVNITRDLLSELLEMQSNVIAHYDSGTEISFHVLTSDIPDVFSMGGDLKYFFECVKQKNKEGLVRYARDSVDLMYQTTTNYERPITTITLIKGTALGGGFEAALAANYLIAEEQAVFSFPETRYGLFPGMGAYTFLRQRISIHQAEEIIYSSRNYSAKELYEMNVIDCLCKKGTGDKTTLQFIQKRQQRHHGIHALRKMVRKYPAIDKQELYSIVDHWVETIIGLDTKQINLISSLYKNFISKYKVAIIN